MPTNLIGSGESYTTVAGWESARDATYSEDWIAELKAQDFLEDNAGFSGSTPGGYQTIIRPATAARHAGKWDATKAHLTSSASVAWNIQEPKFTIEGMQFDCTWNAAFSNGGMISADNYQDIKIKDSIFRYTGGGAYGSALRLLTSTVGNDVLVHSNVIYDFPETGIKCVDSQGEVSNNTIRNCAIGFSGNFGAVTLLMNNVTRNCPDGYFDLFNPSSDFNSSDVSGDAPVQAPRDNTQSPWYSGGTTDADIFVDAANDDYHIKSESIFDGVGGDRSAVFTVDVDGETITSWPLGADMPTQGSSGPNLLTLLGVG